MTTPTTDRLAEAATARAAAFRDPNGEAVREAAPSGLGAARSLPFPATMRAQIVERGGVDKYRLSGVASTTDQPYEMFDSFGAYRETVSRAAFAETLQRNPDVAFLVNHRGTTMARTSNGTLELRLGPTGLESDAYLNPERQDVKDLVLAIQDGDITEMSFAFMLEQGEWSEDFRDFTITKLDIDRGDVSAVNYGANPYTSIAARSREILAELDEMPSGFASEAVRRLCARSDVLAADVARAVERIVEARVLAARPELAIETTPSPSTATDPNHPALVVPSERNETSGGSVAMFEAMLAIGD